MNDHENQKERDDRRTTIAGGNQPLADRKDNRESDQWMMEENALPGSNHDRHENLTATYWG